MELREIIARWFRREILIFTCVLVRVIDSDEAINYYNTFANYFTKFFFWFLRDDKGTCRDGIVILLLSSSKLQLCIFNLNLESIIKSRTGESICDSCDWTKIVGLIFFSIQMIELQLLLHNLIISYFDQLFWI